MIDRDCSVLPIPKKVTGMNTLQVKRHVVIVTTLHNIAM